MVSRLNIECACHWLGYMLCTSTSNPTLSLYDLEEFHWDIGFKTEIQMWDQWLGAAPVGGHGKVERKISVVSSHFRQVEVKIDHIKKQSRWNNMRWMEFQKIPVRLAHYGRKGWKIGHRETWPCPTHYQEGTPGGLPKVGQATYHHCKICEL